MPPSYDPMPHWTSPVQAARLSKWGQNCQAEGHNHSSQSHNEHDDHSDQWSSHGGQMGAHTWEEGRDDRLVSVQCHYYAERTPSKIWYELEVRTALPFPWSSTAGGSYTHCNTRYVVCYYVGALKSKVLWFCAITLHNYHMLEWQCEILEGQTSSERCTCLL